MTRYDSERQLSHVAKNNKGETQMGQVRCLNETLAEAKHNFIQRIRSRKNSVKEMIKTFKETLRAEREDYRREVHNIETNRLAVQLLTAARIDVEVPFSSRCQQRIVVSLSSAKKVPNVRHALGVRLREEVSLRDVVDRAHGKIWRYLLADEFPGLQIRFKAKIPEGAKCRIRRRTSTSSYRQLVCDL